MLITTYAIDVGILSPSSIYCWPIFLFIKLTEDYLNLGNSMGERVLRSDIPKYLIEYIINVMYSDIRLTSLAAPS